MATKKKTAQKKEAPKAETQSPQVEETTQEAQDQPQEVIQEQTPEQPQEAQEAQEVAQDLPIEVLTTFKKKPKLKAVYMAEDGFFFDLRLAKKHFGEDFEKFENPYFKD